MNVDLKVPANRNVHLNGSDVSDREHEAQAHGDEAPVHGDTVVRWSTAGLGVLVNGALGDDDDECATPDAAAQMHDASAVGGQCDQSEAASRQKTGAGVEDAQRGRRMAHDGKTERRPGKLEMGPGKPEMRTGKTGKSWIHRKTTEREHVERAAATADSLPQSDDGLGGALAGRNGQKPCSCCSYFYADFETDVEGDADADVEEEEEEGARRAAAQRPGRDRFRFLSSAFS
mmetsp:Transcript_15701/g.40169  ORF Transcript_15701/g.40169 Transcript_15701/m.40169 type:complete len:231 (-) Transcript_15701:45-737(-)